MRHNGLFVTGVDTAVGKSVVAGALAYLLREEGYSVGLMKAVQTGVKGKKGTEVSPDLELMKDISGVTDQSLCSVPYSFAAPLSPYHAAKAEKTEIEIGHIADEFERLKQKNDFVIVEGSGGLMVPLTQTEFWPDLIRMLDLPVLIVTHLKLGMIHQTLSTVMAAEMHGLESVGIIAVETDGSSHPEPDIKLLEEHTNLPLLAVLPYSSALKEGKADIKKMRREIKKNIPVEPIEDFLERKDAGKKQKRLEKADRENVWHPFTQMREWQDESMLIVNSASGMMLKDVHGRSYYDGNSSYWVNVHGHANRQIMRKIVRQSGRLAHSTFLGLSNPPAIELAERLVEISPESLNKVFYSDNGSTAVEVGLKMAVQYFQQIDNPKPKKTGFIALKNGYHGDTLGALGVGGVEMYRKIFDPLLPDVTHVESPYCYRCALGRSYPSCLLACATEMEETVAKHHKKTAAFIIEPMVQCPGGIITAPHGYLKRVREVCDKYDILMLADEVAVGFGRTGKMFACEHEEVEPDLMAVSKSIAAGAMPLGATLTNRKVFDAFLGEYDERKSFFHGHTFTGYPLACAVALESLDMYRENKIIESLEEKEQFLRDELVRFENLEHVGDIRQLGMIVGIELVENRETKKPFRPSLRTGHRVIMEARKRGLIVRPLGDVVVFFPILSAGTKELGEMAGILYESIAQIS